MVPLKGLLHSRRPFLCQQGHESLQPDPSKNVLLLAEKKVILFSKKIFYENFIEIGCIFHSCYFQVEGGVCFKNIILGCSKIFFLDDLTNCYRLYFFYFHFHI